MTACSSGWCKSILIADTIGSWVDDGFLPKAAALNTTIDNWALAIAFGIQIYFDFAAYSNMAIGAAQLSELHFLRIFGFPIMLPIRPISGRAGT